MSWFDPLNPGVQFSRYFELILAESPQLQDEVFRIRHQVYCEELSYERVTPDGRELDEYDRHSKHLLLRTVNTGVRVGCTRLVLQRPEQPSFPLPFERACTATIDRRLIDPAALPRDSIAEVSRLAVVREFRRRKGEERTKDGAAVIDYGTPKQPRFPYIQLGLFLGAVALARQLGIKTIFFLTEPRLSRHFEKLGFPVQQIGGPIGHRGVRVPSMASVDETINGLRFYMRPIYKVVARQIDSGIGQVGRG
jgi:N-acyl amino acid synthase of PEP-CTERM/exosortase system